MEGLKEYFKKAVHLLTPVEQQVMKFRFGVDGSPIYSVEQIALELQLGVEEIREIEEAAKAKLRGFRDKL